MMTPQPLALLNTTVDKILHSLSICTSPTQLHQVLAQLILQNLHSNTTIAHHFITASQSLGLLASTLPLFTHYHTPHVFICNSLIRAFSHSRSPCLALSVYTLMHQNSISNNYTFPFTLRALSELQDLRNGQCLHTHITKLGHYHDIYVQNAILSLYSSCGTMDFCQQVFDEIPHRDVVSWTALITGNRKAGKNGDALIAFEKMQYAGLEPNRVTMVNALAACASVRALEMGIWIHDFIRKKGWELDVILGTSLVGMYWRCGRVEEGLEVFMSMDEKNVSTWNAVIKGFALAKGGDEAVRWFFWMQQEGFKADEVTLLGVLHACSRSGLVEKGREIFDSITLGKYGFPPNIRHYSCMIDLLCRGGHLVDAFTLMTEMAFEPTKATWGALLAGSRMHGEMELSELAAKKLVELEPQNGTHYAQLSSLYAEMGRWNDLESVRREMKERGLEKDLDCNIMELESESSYEP